MTPDVEEVVASLRAIASASRFRLLSQLRSPRALEEILLAPGPGRAGDAPERPITRQAVQRHLDVLIGVGLVRREETPGRITYVLDHSRLFALQEELRAATAYGSVFDTTRMETLAIQPGTPEAWPAGPKLIQVHGARQGHAYALSAQTRARGRGWTIGRGKDASVRLAYDPYASSESAEILETPSGLHLVGIGRNPVTLNWRHVEQGTPTKLAEGDVIGVGRTLLLFRRA